ncbi:MAG: hypothetical protein HY765_03360, partial [Rhodomicrobium sp.]|nr:hypothetical protein [Rhodomicrobium sp.]
MTPEGRIAIDLFPRASGAAKIVSSRPLTISRQFSGHRPEDIVQTVSLLFAVCKAAQSVASAEAFEEALGIEASTDTKRIRALLVLMEMAREHALRILIDWPAFLPEGGQPSPAGALKALMQIFRDFERFLDERGAAMQIGGKGAAAYDGIEAASRRLKALLEDAIFGEDPVLWRERIAPENIAGWARSGKTPAQRLMHQVFDNGLPDAGAAPLAPLPPLDRAQLAGHLFAEDADGFVATPKW